MKRVTRRRGWQQLATAAGIAIGAAGGAPFQGISRTGPPTVSAATAAGALAAAHERPAPQRRRRKTVWDVLGIHDTPNSGGSRNLEEFHRHLSHLCARWVIGIIPRPEWYYWAEQIGAVPITRLMLPGNRFDEEVLRRQLAGVPPNSLVLPFNEPNLIFETPYPVLPELHAQDLIMAAEVIAQAGSTTLITPLAQEGALIPEPGVMIYELEYFQRMLTEMTNLQSVSWIRQHMALAFHNYHLKYNINPGSDPFHRLGAYYAHLVVPIIGRLDIYITEGGYFLADVPAIDYYAVAEDTVALLDTELPPALSDHIKMWSLWVYANMFQRPPEHQREWEVQRIERTALWQASGPTPIYHAIVEYGRRRRAEGHD
ncbi:MAG TPA: hypothetical protein VHS99_06245 [Chloroflexota bacterium]|nr:hypothetical protein [Chloroflexota bacterium]